MSWSYKCIHCGSIELSNRDHGKTLGPIFSMCCGPLRTTYYRVDSPPPEGGDKVEADNKPVCRWCTDTGMVTLLYGAKPCLECNGR